MSQIEQALIEAIFADSVTQFLEREATEITEGVNERNNCSRWAMYLEHAAHRHGLTGYCADTEYNRKQNGMIKTILDEDQVVVAINCDLILHSRGLNVAEDNLIAIEVKKADRPPKEKEDDRRRLRALTKASYDDIWMNDGSNPPEHVCGYRFGAFVELDRKRRRCVIECYKEGVLESSTEHYF